MTRILATREDRTGTSLREGLESYWRDVMECRKAISKASAEVLRNKSDSLFVSLMLPSIPRLTGFNKNLEKDWELVSGMRANAVTLGTHKSYFDMHSARYNQAYRMRSLDEMRRIIQNRTQNFINSVIINDMKVCGDRTLFLRVTRESPSYFDHRPLSDFYKYSTNGYPRMTILNLDITVPTNYISSIYGTGIINAFSKKSKRYGLPLNSEHMGREGDLEIYACDWLTWVKSDKEFVEHRGYVCVNKKWNCAAAGASVQQAKRSLSTIVKNEMMKALHDAL